MVSTGCDHLRAAQPVTRAIRFHPTKRYHRHLRRRSQLLATMSVTRRSWFVVVDCVYVQPLTRAIRFSPVRATPPKDCTRPLTSPQLELTPTAGRWAGGQGVLLAAGGAVQQPHHGDLPVRHRHVHTPGASRHSASSSLLPPICVSEARVETHRQCVRNKGKHCPHICTPSRPWRR
jgi:hypothetical protein